MASPSSLASCRLPHRRAQIAAHRPADARTAASHQYDFALHCGYCFDSPDATRTGAPDINESGGFTITESSSEIPDTTSTSVP